MWPLWFGVFFMVGSGAAAAVMGRGALSRWLGGVGIAAGSLLAAIPMLQHLTGVAASVSIPWGIPLGLGALGLDGLSAFFGLLVVGVCGLAALYGISYLKHDDEHRRTGGTWLLFGLLEASMLGVVLARDGVVFLISWEVMTLASFGLVVFDHYLPSVRRAGLIYLIAGHVGAAALFVLFLVLSGGDFSMAFENFAVSGNANFCFVLALIGFGTKAGFVPLHVWLPEAHSSAPSHVSAVMSGVMLKMGVYGLVRMLQVFGPQVPAWWGITLVVIGGLGAVMGLLFALAQTDVKRVLAYSSVENLGIIALGIGLGLLGWHLGNPVLTWLGFGGALLHSLNHALFKTLLFFGAGALLHSVGTRHLERMGGLARRLPVLATLILVGSVALAGLPPLNGFVGELLLYCGAWQGVNDARPWVASTHVGVVLVLALVGGLAVACFTRLYGVAFLGEPRSAQADEAHPVSWLMLAPMAVLAVGCVAVALAAGWVLQLLPIAGLATEIQQVPIQAEVPVSWAAMSAAALLGLTAMVWAIRRWMMGQQRRTFGTWDCGYTAPTVRMQYTASSYAQPLTQLFGWLLRTHTAAPAMDQEFPGEARFLSHTDDLVLHRGMEPGFHWIDRLLAAGRVLQGGRVQVYILYILLTLILLLAYQLEG